MSRSRRKTPIHGITTAESDHRWKKAAARKVRRRVRQLLPVTLDSDRLPNRRWELVNPWSSEKDGKCWLKNPDPRWMRK